MARVRTLFPLLLASACSDDRGGADTSALTFTSGATEEVGSEIGDTNASTSNSDTATDGTGSGDGDGDGDGDPRGTPTEENLRVAFIGDQGLGSDAQQVLELVIAEQAQYLIIAGDFDYDDNPQAWDDQNVGVVGAEYPIFAVGGNHDEAAWFGVDGYESKVIERRQNAIDDGAVCTGAPGANSACTYKGLFLAMSGVDVFNGQAESGDYLRSELAGNDAIWSVCVWHKNQTDMQAGDKGDEAGWEVYQACQDQAAIIVTGHEHSYARTRTLSDVGNEPNGHGAIGEHEQVVVGEGSTVVVVSGMGGNSLREYDAGLHGDDTWWSTLYTSNYYLKDGEVQGSLAGDSGVLFIDFYVDGDPYKAYAWFKSTSGTVLDEFEIIRDPQMTGDGDDDTDGTTGGDPADLVITDFEDAYVDSAAPTMNIGAAPDLLIDTDPAIYEIFIKPNGVETIPPGTMIEGATLRLYAHNDGDSGEIREVTEAWTEAAITYDTRPASAAPFTTFAADLGWVEIDVTSVVQAWVDGGAVLGFHLRSDGGDGSDYYASEGLQGPELLVWY